MGPVPKKPQGQALEGENVTWGSERGTQGPELLKPLEAVAGGGPGATAPLQPCTWGARHPAPGVPLPLLAVRTGTPYPRSVHWLSAHASPSGALQ